MYNYRNFIVEKLCQMVLESKIEFSLNFANVLRNINSPLSAKVLALNNQEKDTVQYNYIDSSYEENDTVSFILDSRAKKMLADTPRSFRIADGGRHLGDRSLRNQKIFIKLGYTPPPDRYRSHIGDVGKIISEIVGVNRNTYCYFECTKSTAGNIGKRCVINKEVLAPDEDLQKVWTTASMRSKIKVGRFVTSLLKTSGIEVTPKEIEEFVNSYKSTIDILKDAFRKFDIVSGEKIVHFYHYSNYNVRSGTLGNSCMSNVPPEWLNIYSANPEICSLVILYDDNGRIENGKYTSSKILGRALLWTTVDGEKFLDRIYTIKDSDVNLFKKFANQNKWWQKCNQDSSSDFTAVRDKEFKNHAVFIVQLEEWNKKNPKFPYMDTFSYFNPRTSKLSNNEGTIRAKWRLTYTDGGHNDFS